MTATGSKSGIAERQSARRDLWSKTATKRTTTMRMLQYQIAGDKCRDVAKLANQVQHEIGLGWFPLGGPFADGIDPVYFYQAMTRTVEEDSSARIPRNPP